MLIAVDGAQLAKVRTLLRMNRQADAKVLADGVLEAILWHGGEATASRDRFVSEGALAYLSRPSSLFVVEMPRSCHYVVNVCRMTSGGFPNNVRSGAR